MTMGTYAPFIIASYAVTFGAVFGMVLHAILAERKQQKALALLEAQGIRRRSEAAKQKSEL